MPSEHCTGKYQFCISNIHPSTGQYASNGFLTSVASSRLDATINTHHTNTNYTQKMVAVFRVQNIHRESHRTGHTNQRRNPSLCEHTLSFSIMSQKLRGGFTSVRLSGITKHTACSLSTIAVKFCNVTTARHHGDHRHDNKSENAITTTICISAMPKQIITPVVQFAILKPAQPGIQSPDRNKLLTMKLWTTIRTTV